MTTLVAVLLLGEVGTQSPPPSSYLELLPDPNLQGREVLVAEKLRALRGQVIAHPESAEAWGRLGMNFAVHALTNEAVICYRQAARLDPTEFRWPYYCAIVLQEMGFLKEALQWFEDGRALRPGYVPLQLRYGQALFDAGRLNDASQAFTRAIMADPPRVHGYFGLARISIFQDNVEEARRHILRALELAPEQREGHGLMAEVYRRLKNLEKAEQESQRAQSLPMTEMPDPMFSLVSAEGTSSLWLRKRGENHLKQKKFLRAVEIFRQLVELKPHNTIAWNSLAASYMGAGLMQAAEKAFQKAMSLSPGNSRLHYNYGNFFLQRGKWEHAVEKYRRAIELEPGFAPVHYNLSVALQKLGHSKEAAKAREAHDKLVDP